MGAIPVAEYQWVVWMPRPEHQRAVWLQIWDEAPAADWWQRYTAVGVMAVTAPDVQMALEEAWRRGQNDFAPGGTWHAGAPVRSLSVGDVLVAADGSSAWMVAPVGFVPAPVPSR